MDHSELVQEMASLERMAAQDRLKQAKKRRQLQLKKWNQYEKQLEKDSSKKSKKKTTQQLSGGKGRARASTRVQFAPNIALLEAAARNDLEEVRRLLQSGVSPSVTNEDGLTALHQCCIDDNEEMLKLLLEYGADVNACDSELWTPLHAAATCGHVTLCKHLIDRGADLLSVNADGNMPYDICEDEVTLDYIESEMAKKGITQEQIDNTRLVTERQMLNDLKQLVASGGDLEVRDASGASFLHIAAANGYMEVADFLLDHHVSVDCRDNESWQPIHAAAYWGQLDVLELLVQNGADLDAKTKNGETPSDLSEDPEVRLRILQLKDEIAINKASRQRPGSGRKLKHNSRNSALSQHQEPMYSSNSSLNSKTSGSASMRRSSLKEKGGLSKKEAKEEALHFGMRLMADDEDLGVLDEEKENVPSTNLDDVTVTVDYSETRRNTKNINVPTPSVTKSPQTVVKPTFVVEPPKEIMDLSTDKPPTTEKPLINNKPTTNEKPTIAQPNAYHLSNKNSTNRSGALTSIPKASNGQDKLPLYPQHDKLPLYPQESSPKIHQKSEVLEINANDETKDSLDDQFQMMFLDRIPQLKHSGSISSSVQSQPVRIYPPPMMVANGYNMGGSTTGSLRSNYREPQLQRFVAPPTSPAVGAEDEEKHGCCVIL